MSAVLKELGAARPAMPQAPGAVRVGGALRPGVHSEVGRLRSVLVCRPGLAHRRLTPENRADWAFRDLLWVDRAQQDFDAFVAELSRRDVEVLELHELLAQILDQARARRWLLDRALDPDSIGPAALDALHAAMTEMPSSRLAELLVGGMTAADLPAPLRRSAAAFLQLDEYLLPPLPNTLLARDASSWIHGGVTLNRSWWPTRRGETLLANAIYRFHPRFGGDDMQYWCGDGRAEPCPAGVEGADVMTLGAGVVLIGVNRRTSARGAMRIARALFGGGAARVVIVAQFARADAALPLDAVFTQCSPEVVTYAPGVIDRVVCHELRPAAQGAELQFFRHDGRHMLDVLSETLGAPAFNAIATGAGRFDGGGEGWDEGNNLLALEPGVVVGFDRNTRTNRRLREAGVEVVEVPGSELARGRIGPHAMTCPIVREAVGYA